ncbi:MAG TPA: hypothetical protein VFT89_07435 [Rhizobiaceae bacterium]|nr:hypothetical protein [Rhizobiaceae bacterium]
MFLAYERDFSGRWCPVVYADKPKATDSRSAPIEVPADCIVNGEVVWGKLQARFPAPKEGM